MARILIVDDAPSDLKLMQAILVHAGHSVSTLNDPTLAEDHVIRENTDLILLDVVMPARNGYDVLRGLKRNAGTKHVPVVLVSSKSNETDVRWGLRQGASRYVTKPFEPDGLLRAVGEALGSVSAT